VMTLGSFGVVMAMEGNGPGAGRKGTDDIARYHGLGYSRPFLGALMALFMLSLAGIPPGVAGLLAKFYVFSAAVKADFWGLAIIGMINSAISAYYYLRVIVAMYFIEPDSEQQDIKANGQDISASLVGVLGLCAVGVVFLGLFPGFIIETAGFVFGSI